MRFIQNERGMALVLAIGITTVLAIAGTTAIAYSTSSATQATQSRARQSTFSLAEAGMSNAMAVLNLPTNNALDPETLPKCTTNDMKYTASGAARTDVSTWMHSTINGGTASWCGTLIRKDALWYVTSIGSQQNPIGPKAGSVARTLEATVTVVPTMEQPLNNPVWNYLYAGHTGSTCDQTLSNNISGSSRMYVAGNLCLSPNVSLAQSTVIVRGNLDVSNNAAVGASTSLATRVETYVGGNCRYSVGSWVACSGNQDANHIYSKLSDGTTTQVNHIAPLIAPPAADFAKWYENAIPGPSQSCTTASGTTPTFDGNYPSRDNSVSTVFDLTPASSYTCRVGPGASTTLGGAMTASQTTLTVASATGFPTSSFSIRIDDEYMTVTGGFGTTVWTVTRGAHNSTATTHVISQTVNLVNDQTPNWAPPASGELSWNATTKTLTVTGTILIDGGAKVSNSAMNSYNGQGTLYLSGTLRLTGSLCGKVSGTTCDTAGWKPDDEMLMIVANGSGGQVNPGDSIFMDNNNSYQGGLYGVNAVEFGNNASVDGPIVGSQILLSNNLVTNSFPTISEVPSGMPSNNDVYAQPNPPQGFTG
jgi:Tfp pilus assembly protein PilX